MLSMVFMKHFSPTEKKIHAKTFTPIIPWDTSMAADSTALSVVFFMPGSNGSNAAPGRSFSR